MKFLTNEEIDEKKNNTNKKIATVVHYLLRNPLSTAEEIFRETGIGVKIASKFVKSKKYNNKICWRVNHLKWDAVFK